MSEEDQQVVVEEEKSNFKIFLMALVLAFLLGISIAQIFYKDTGTQTMNPTEVIKRRRAFAPEQRRQVEAMPPQQPAETAAPSAGTTAGEAADPASAGAPEETVATTPSPPSPSAAQKFSRNMQNLSELSIEQIEDNIDLANELIQQNPNYYGAYKGKLMSLLTKELKYGGEVSPEQYEEIYNELLNFEGSAATDANGEPATEELADIDRDLIHIPFLRFSALNDLDTLATISQDYIAAYPDSYLGYYYLAEAMWKNGDQEDAAFTLRQGLERSSNQQLTEYFIQQMQKNPLERIQGL